MGGAHPIGRAVSVIVGIFVGGSGSRLGGVAKGLLRAPASSESLLARLLGVCGGALPGSTPVLVGRSAAYVDFGLRALDDDPAGIGPLGGFRALLKHAERERAERVLALACDLPFLDARTLSQLNLPLKRAARVPFTDGKWQPLAAAYAPRATLTAVEKTIARGERALMRVLDELGPELEKLEGDAAFAHALSDWDAPEDIGR